MPDGMALTKKSVKSVLQYYGTDFETEMAMAICSSFIFSCFILLCEKRILTKKYDYCETNDCICDLIVQKA